MNNQQKNGMTAENVKPKKWLWDNDYPIRVLYDNDDYSIVWGKFEGDRALGVRWSGESDHVGYPNQGGNPTWYVEPDFIATAILQRLLTLAIDKNDMKYLDNITFAIKELTDKLASRENC